MAVAGRIVKDSISQAIVSTMPDYLVVAKGSVPEDRISTKSNSDDVDRVAIVDTRGASGPRVSC